MNFSTERYSTASPRPRSSSRVAPPLQHQAPAFITWLSPANSRGRAVGGFAILSRFAGHPGRSAKTRYAQRLKPDHPIRAGQSSNAAGAVPAFRDQVGAWHPASGACRASDRAEPVRACQHAGRKPPEVESSVSDPDRRGSGHSRGRSADLRWGASAGAGLGGRCRGLSNVGPAFVFVRVPWGTAQHGCEVHSCCQKAAWRG